MLKDPEFTISLMQKIDNALAGKTLEDTAKVESMHGYSEKTPELLKSSPLLSSPYITSAIPIVFLLCVMIMNWEVLINSCNRKKLASR